MPSIRGAFVPTGRTYLCKLIHFYDLQRQDTTYASFAHSGVFHTNGYVLSTVVYFTQLAVFCAQWYISHNWLYFVHSGIFQTKGCILCTVVYFTQRAVFCAQWYISHNWLYFEHSSIFLP
jgi:hypothetical protein